jgi:ABC-type multidrug transport system ATPase subunit
VDHVDLAIEPGETFGLLGPNGAGKTTTIRMLITLLKPMTGRLTVFGTSRPAHRAPSGLSQSRGPAAGSGCASWPAG